LENDPSWVADPKKNAIVRRLQLYPLKMSYFANDPKTVADGGMINVPLYDKMAIFPLFRFHATSTVGEKLYTRMNRPGNELDMIAFESAVKVGLNQNTYSPYQDKTESLD
jgi:hypothetical protein